jgi:Concanavalin A-like lectin/glucanases superfamily
MTIYVNGSSQASSAAAASYCGQQPFSIGNDVANSGPFYAGKIDDVRTYSGALSGASITSIYNSGVAGNP